MVNGTHEILAAIPARGGSQGIPRKNILNSAAIYCLRSALRRAWGRSGNL